MNWISFLRQYGPIPRNNNMYDESIHGAAKRANVSPIAFEHPFEQRVLKLFSRDGSPVSTILTGTAGDGKTHLCRRVWEMLTGETTGFDAPYVHTTLAFAGGKTSTIHIVKDLSEWAPQSGQSWDPQRQALLERFCDSILDTSTDDIFLIAGNDGQLIESWRRLPGSENVSRCRDIFERMLVDNQSRLPGINLEFLNLSSGNSSELFDRALDALLSHEGWNQCAPGGEREFFGPNCPIRHNYELLKIPLVRKRLRSLFELCDHNDLHISIRQILLLLSNALLGHPDVKDCLMRTSDVSGVIEAGTISKGNLYSNIFGSNLGESRRLGLEVFEYLDRFRIGNETNNHIDDILIFGDADEKYKKYFDLLMGSDPLYGADEIFRTAQMQYIEGADDTDGRYRPFLDQLVSKRRGLFFTIPESLEGDLGLWDLTVFRFAGEYLNQVLPALRARRAVEQPILARLIKGLNRIFSGMLVTSDRELLIATSISCSGAKVSRLLDERLSVRPRWPERIEIVLEGAVPALRVSLTDEIGKSLALHLVRYEFLSRVAEGALPGSFSRECYEDILAFKSQLVSAVAKRRGQFGESQIEHGLAVRLLSLDDSGNPLEETIEVANV
jgi:hypothetical protein